MEMAGTYLPQLFIRIKLTITLLLLCPNHAEPNRCALTGYFARAFSAAALVLKGFDSGVN
jgi:hypothetical protein